MVLTTNEAIAFSGGSPDRFDLGKRSIGNMKRLYQIPKYPGFSEIYNLIILIIFLKIGMIYLEYYNMMDFI